MMNTTVNRDEKALHVELGGPLVGLAQELGEGPLQRLDSIHFRTQSLIGLLTTLADGCDDDGTQRQAYICIREAVETIELLAADRPLERQASTA